MFLELKKSHPKNMIYSPFSLSTVMAMVKLGARGITAEEIAKTLKYPPDDAFLTQGYFQILSSLQERNEGYTLAMANKIYSKMGFRIQSVYLKEVKDTFLAEIEQLDFVQNDQAAKTINKWVEFTTQGKIKDLIAADDLSEDTRLVLVNAIYFKGLWKDGFKAASTSKSPFYLNKMEQVQVQMMYKQAKFPYAQFPQMDAHAVALPYKGERLCMVIIAPRQKTGLAKIEHGLKKYTPKKILESLYAGDTVAVRLPRFKIKSTFQLVPMLKKLGITSMFRRDKADFRGIPEKEEDLYVSQVIQKAFIEVNEEGSEASAATALVSRTVKGIGGNRPIIIPFDADRPFFYEVVDRHTNFVLFAGRCCNPLE